MFWSGNYIGTKEVNCLLKEEALQNVKLTKILEADDILQECKAENKTLIQYLTQPEILAELVSYIIEEPPRDMELSQQYRHASLACEVLTSQLPALTERLAVDTPLMHKLCDFINREPPLNPLLASYYSKTIETLLEKSPQQDYCLYRIVCLQVLDLFRSRRDFLPNLLRHISTSSIADIFKYFIRLEDFFHNFVMEWFEEHKVLESLIHIICGTYVPPPLSPVGSPDAPDPAPAPAPAAVPVTEQTGNKEDAGGTDIEEATEGGAREGEDTSMEDINKNVSEGNIEVSSVERVRARRSAVEATNVATLLADLLLTFCCGENYTSSTGIGMSLRGRLLQLSEVLLCNMFTSAAAARLQALARGAALLRAMLHDRHDDTDGGGGAGAGAGAGAGRQAVEWSVAPHLPLLHQELLRDPHHYQGGGPPSRRVVGCARLQVCALLARLAASELHEVISTMITLGTPGVILQLMLDFPDNNFMAAHFRNFLENALNNQPYRTQFIKHFFQECDLLTKLMDVYEENEAKIGSGAPRSAVCGHVILCLRAACAAAEDSELPAALRARWDNFHEQVLQPTLLTYATPLGGTYPSNNIYEDEIIAANYDLSEAAAAVADCDNLDDVNDVIDPSDSDYLANVESLREKFTGVANHRFDMYDDDTEDGEELSGDALAQDVLTTLQLPSPWESAGDDACAAEDWANFNDNLFDPFADSFPPPDVNTDGNTESTDRKTDAFDSHDEDFGSFEQASNKEEYSIESKEKCENTEDGAWGGNTVEGAGDTSAADLECNLEKLHFKPDLVASTAELADHLLTAMSSLSAADIAHIANNGNHIHIDVTRAGIPDGSTSVVNTSDVKGISVERTADVDKIKDGITSDVANPDIYEKTNTETSDSVSNSQSSETNDSIEITSNILVTDKAGSSENATISNKTYAETVADNVCVPDNANVIDTIETNADNTETNTDTTETNTDTTETIDINNDKVGDDEQR